MQVARKSAVTAADLVRFIELFVVDDVDDDGVVDEFGVDRELFEFKPAVRRRSEFFVSFGGNSIDIGGSSCKNFNVQKFHFFFQTG